MGVYIVDYCNFHFTPGSIVSNEYKDINGLLYLEGITSEDKYGGDTCAHYKSTV